MFRNQNDGLPLAAMSDAEIRKKGAMDGVHDATAKLGNHANKKEWTPHLDQAPHLWQEKFI